MRRTGIIFITIMLVSSVDACCENSVTFTSSEVTLLRYKGEEVYRSLYSLACMRKNMLEYESHVDDSTGVLKLEYPYVCSHNWEENPFYLNPMISDSTDTHFLKYSDVERLTMRLQQIPQEIYPEYQELMILADLNQTGWVSLREAEYTLLLIKHGYKLKYISDNKVRNQFVRRKMLGCSQWQEGILSRDYELLIKKGKNDDILWLPERKKPNKLLSVIGITIGMEMNAALYSGLVSYVGTPRTMGTIGMIFSPLVGQGDRPGTVWSLFASICLYNIIQGNNKDISDDQMFVNNMIAWHGLYLAMGLISLIDPIEEDKTIVPKIVLDDERIEFGASTR